ncbi:MAG TPA: GspMb/PilO family protein [Blastocatellia bacterium]|nr:GspMb/PilO family protein [Blastocatellia bacterium]
MRERISQVDVRSPRIKTLPFGLSWVEILALTVALIVVAVAVTRFWTALRPEQVRLRQLEQQLADQQRDIIQSTPGVPSTTSPGEVAQQALDSLEQFKTNHLKRLQSGEIELLNEVNALAKKSSVQLMSGIDTTRKIPGQIEEDAAAGQKKTSKQRKPEEILGVFPALAARFSVSGEYTNLRSFITALESSKQFLLVNTVNITNQEGRITGRSRRIEAAGGLMLSIEMTAYFRTE